MFGYSLYRILELTLFIAVELVIGALVGFVIGQWLGSIFYDKDNKCIYTNLL